MKKKGGNCHLFFKKNWIPYEWKKKTFFPLSRRSFQLQLSSLLLLSELVVVVATQNSECNERENRERNAAIIAKACPSFALPPSKCHLRDYKMAANSFMCSYEIPYTRALLYSKLKTRIQNFRFRNFYCIFWLIRPWCKTLTFTFYIFTILLLLYEQNWYST